ncbi:DUF397 domain-containing protein [Streptomyces sp. x-80]|uniref:DUF397 domain-containing protein n=1 Tax=Streptomyces sp. x-80 TaxID=2789282 RepID=UPI00397F2BB7
MTHETLDWTSSSYSQNNGGECIEWAPTSAAATGIVSVRDSKAPQGPQLVFPASSWTAFVADIKTGDFRG